jgi:putative transcriptional regulator
VPAKSQPLSKSELAAFEAKRDLAADLLASVRRMKAGQTQVVTSPVIEARK